MMPPIPAAAIHLILLLMASTHAWSGEPNQRFSLGVINERADRPSFALEQYGPLQTYLESRLASKGIDVGELVITKTLEEMAEQIESGTVDAVIEGVMPTFRLQRETAKLDIGLLVWRKGQRQYHTVFFTRKESPVQHIEQLGGKTIAFESLRSTSAYAIPQAALIEAGLRLAPKEVERPSDTFDPDLVWFEFAGSELNQAYWVHAQRADAGAFNDGDWERVPDSIKADLRIFHRTAPILRWLLSFERSVDPQVRNAVNDVLEAMHLEPEGQVALQAASSIARFDPLMDEDRDNLDYWEKVLSAVEPSNAQ